NDGRRYRHRKTHECNLGRTRLRRQASGCLEDATGRSPCPASALGPTAEPALEAVAAHRAIARPMAWWRQSPHLREEPWFAARPWSGDLPALPRLAWVGCAWPAR